MTHLPSTPPTGQDVTHVDVESYEEGGEPRSCIMLARRDPGRKPTMLRTDDDEECAEMAAVR